MAATASLGVSRCRLSKRTDPGGVRFLRCRSEVSEARAIAASIEKLLSEGTPAEAVAIVSDPLAERARPTVAALRRRGVPCRSMGVDALFHNVEVRDLIGWLRLLADPGDTTAVARALVTAPIELSSADLARCVHIARRRKTDLASAVEAACQDSRFAPPTQDKLRLFLQKRRDFLKRFDSDSADAFVYSMVEDLELRRQHLLVDDAESAERTRNTVRLVELAARFGRYRMDASSRDFVRYLEMLERVSMWEPAGPPESTAAGVTVCSPAGAAGSEFDALFLIGLERSAIGRSEPEEFYRVAARAGTSLFLSWVDGSGTGAVDRMPAVSRVRETVGGPIEDIDEMDLGDLSNASVAFRMLRGELLDTVGRVGAGLTELRLDTYLDVNHAVARFLEFLKLAALVQDDHGRDLGERLSEVNGLLSQVATHEQREVLASSSLDGFLLASDRDEGRLREAIRSRLEPSLESFLPKHGGRLALSVTDIETYRACPLKYKFLRVLSLPRKITVQQRFGILVHQVLERYHSAVHDEGGLPSLDVLLDLFDRGWRKAGFDSDEKQLEYRYLAVQALKRYHELESQSSTKPVWFERKFAFSLDGFSIRGRVDRVDRLPDGTYELIDYKTGRPPSGADLETDVQLSLYRMAAAEAWDLGQTCQSYYYVLDSHKVAVKRTPEQLEHVKETVIDVGGGIQRQDFEPRPSLLACSRCEFSFICPADER